MNTYTSIQFKNDLLENIKVDSNWNPKTLAALEIAEFSFNDSGKFTYKEWNTYTRTLNINCRGSDKSLLQNLHSKLFKLCDTLHGVKDNFMLMSMTILAKSGLEEVVMISNEIKITSSIIIDKKNDYLGQGGFSIVYKKQDPATDMMYTYKVLDPSPFHGSDPETIKKRFIREAKKLLSYSHDNIVRAYDFGFSGENSAYIKMEFIEGKNIFDYVKDTPLNNVQRTKLANDYVIAMAYIHSKSDIHRDIHYSNVMVTNAGQVKVLDFGFARNANDTDYDTMFADINRKFTPPDKDYTIQTDVYCVGAVLSVIFTSEDFHISTVEERLNHIENEGYCKAIKKCLKTTPQERFSDCVELNAYLNANDVSEGESNMVKIVNGTETFSLENFRDVVLTLSIIEFSYKCMPTLEIIKNWLDVDFPECINEHVFLSTMELSTLLYKIDGVSRIFHRGEISSTFNKEIFVNVINFYNDLIDDEKIHFANSMKTIIMQCAKEEESLF